MAQVPKRTTVHAVMVRTVAGWAADAECCARDRGVELGQLLSMLS